jgi:hypothetical protein
MDLVLGSRMSSRIHARQALTSCAIRNLRTKVRQDPRNVHTLLRPAAWASSGKGSVLVSLERLKRVNVSAVKQRLRSSCCSWRDNRSSWRAKAASRRPPDDRNEATTASRWRSARVFAIGKLGQAHLRAIAHSRQIEANAGSNGQ